LIDFIPLKTIDEALSGGGNPNARAQQPIPQPPAPQPQRVAPQPKPVRQPAPTKPVEREPAPSKKQPAKDLPDISLNKVTRRETGKPSKQKPAAPSNVKANAQLARAAQNAVQNIRQGMSSSTEIELSGPGGGGVPYANFLDALRKIYTDAWLVPDGVTDDSATATASVTLARDGTVLNAHIISRSGNALADESVQAVLRRVKHAVPLPDGAKENQRTVTIKFNVKAKLLG
jgi:protein TonB